MYHFRIDTMFRKVYNLAIDRKVAIEIEPNFIRLSHQVEWL